jgi:non-specific serine/threonine protein kinase
MDVGKLADAAEGRCTAAAPTSAFGRQVRDALAHLYDPAYLQTHPLIHLIPHDPSTRGVSAGGALRHLLLETIESLRPSGAQVGETTGGSYQVLVRRYVEGVDAATIQAQLALGRSEYFREHRRGLEAVISLLWPCLAGTRQGTDLSSRRDGGEPRPRPIEQLGRAPAGAAGHDHLPVPLTSFVGRESVMAAVEASLATTRLLTLTGAGGVGKTRLALEVARGLAHQYADGAWFVDLAAVGDPALVPQTAAVALGIPEDPHHPIQAALECYLQARHVLLVLDNCEHLIAACARFVAEMLPSCPDLTILATSRESLRIGGEVSWAVPPLTAPDPAGWPATGAGQASRLAEYDGARLFLDRARAALPSFALTDQNTAAVAEICWRLDGIPLAIELAAARVTLLGVEQIAERLDDRFRLLTRGSREALPRHQTLRALVDWSFDLLPERERTLFRRLSVFAGTFGLEAIEAVCGGGALDAPDVLDPLGGLVGKSLVLMAESDGTARYRLLETIRQYARERLAEADETAPVQRRHANWYLGLTERARVEVWGAAEKEWLDRLDADHPNLREALRWFRDHDPAAGLRLAVGLCRFWYDRGLVSEGRRWLEDLLDRAPDRTVVRARALFGLGWLAFQRGDSVAMKSAMEDSIPIFQENGDDRGAGRSLSYLGRVALQEGCYAEAQAFLRRGLAFLREADDRPGIATTLFWLGNLLRASGDDEGAAALLAESRVIFLELRGQGGRDFFVLGQLAELARLQGDYDEARALTNESLVVSREIGHRELVVTNLHRMAALVRAEGDYQQSRVLLGECLDLAQELGHQPWMGRVLIGLAKLSQTEGDYAQARTLFQQSLRIARALGDRAMTASCVGAVGLVATQQGTWAEGVRMIGAVRVTDELFPSRFDPAERAQRSARLDLARVALGEEAFIQAWAAGQAMTLEQAVDLALQQGVAEPRSNG